MFLNLYNIYKKKEIGEEITSFFVQRSVYFAFFRKSTFYLTQKQDEINKNKIDIDIETKQKI